MGKKKFQKAYNSRHDMNHIKDLRIQRLTKSGFRILQKGG